MHVKLSAQCLQWRATLISEALRSIPSACVLESSDEWKIIHVYLTSNGGHNGNGTTLPIDFDDLRRCEEVLDLYDVVTAKCRV